MPKIAHYVLTRFAAKVGFADGVKFAGSVPAPLSPDWIAQRFALFEQYCLPSMRAQTFTEFVWRIYVHPGFDPALASRLRGYDTRIEVVTYPVTPLPVTANGIVASTRIDSDDGFAANALEIVNHYAERFAATTEPAHLLTLARGWWLDHAQQQIYQNRGGSFKALFERRPLYVGVLVCSCDDIGKRYPEWVIKDPLWLRVVHGGNVRNRFDSSFRTEPIGVLCDRGFPWIAPAAPPAPAPEIEALPRVVLTMRTTDRRTGRTPSKDNYLKRTIAQMVDQGIASGLHLAVSKIADNDWVARELGPSLSGIDLIPATRDRSANETALDALAAVDLDRCDWVVMLEDDLAFCKAFVPSVQRWLQRHTRPDRNVYRFFGFHAPARRRVEAFEHPLDKLRASQAIALRSEDARDFLEWARAHLATWRGVGPARHADPGVAFDKLVAAWSLARWPKRPGVLSWPFFVDHVGTESSLHRIGATNHEGFAGRTWSYAEVGA
jgi:hypothetical protein